MASEIRVDKINSLSGVGTVTLSPTGVDIAGITTAATLKATTGIVTTLTATTGIVTTLTTNTLTANSTAKVGSGVTLSPDGDIFATGVTTSTTFVGALTGNVTGTASANAVLSGSTDNTVTTVTGANAIQGESNLKFNGTNLQVGGQTNLGSHTAAITLSNRGTSARSAVEIEGNTGNCHGAVDFRNNGTLVSAINSRGSDRLQFCTGSSGNVKAEVTGNNFKIVASGADAVRSLQIDGTNGSSENQGFIIENDGNNGRINLKLGTGGGTPATKLTLLPAGGITFNGDTAAANALDDYEEGTWAPTLQTQNGSSNATIASAGGYYTKVGRLVHVTFYMSWSGATNHSGYIYFHNLPFTSVASAGGYFQNGVGAVMLHSLPFAGTAPVLLMGSNSTGTNLYFSSTNTGWVPGSHSNTGQIIASLSYNAA